MPHSFTRCRTAVAAALTISALSFHAGAVHRRPTGATAPSQAKPRGELDHRGQVTLRLALAQGVRMVFRRPDSPLCKEPLRTYDYASQRDAFLDDQPDTCGFATAPAFDLAVGLAFLSSFEPFLWTRLGLGPQKDTDTEALRLIGAGARLIPINDAAVKVFVSPALALSLEGGRGRADYQTPQPKPSYGTDLLFHLSAGGQYDFNRNVGAFLDGGATVGLARGLQAELAARLGLELRY